MTALRHQEPGLQDSHSRIWTAIDDLAARHRLSVSALARRAGLDPTTFNISKRFSPNGRPRWPSTESLAKALSAIDESLENFFQSIQPAPENKAFLNHQDLHQLRKKALIQPIGGLQEEEGKTSSRSKVADASSALMPLMASSVHDLYIVHMDKTSLKLPFSDKEIHHIIVAPDKPLEEDELAYVEFHHSGQMIGIVISDETDRLALETGDSKKIQIIDKSTIRLAAAVLWVEAKAV